jgi:guanylate kinase
MPLLIILSGPSGAGKDALLNRMRELKLPFDYVVTSTTRPPRSGEKDGIEYNFVSESGFQEMLQRGDLIESAKVYGYWYGVPKHEVKQGLDAGKDLILKIDVQGAATIRNLLPGAVLVFLTLTSLEEYERRLRQRKTETDTDLKVRLGKVNEELRSMLIFDYVVVNHEGQLDAAVDQIAAIVTAEKCRVSAHTVQFR